MGVHSCAVFRLWVWGGLRSRSADWKANCAEQLAISRLGDLSKTKRIDLITQMGNTTPCSISYGKRLLSLEVEECAEFTDVPNIILPWHLSSSKGELFSLSSPKLAALQCSDQAKVEIFERLVVEHLVVKLVMSGKESESKLMALCSVIAEAINESSADELVKFRTTADMTLAMCFALQALLDPSPVLVASATVEMRLVRSMLMGNDLQQPWTLLSESLDEVPWWADKKREFRRSVTSDMTLGREMKRLTDEVKGGSQEALREAFEKIPGWVSRCRSGGTMAFQRVLLDTVEADMKAILEKPADARLATLKALDELTTKAGAAFAEPDELRQRLASLRKTVRSACEDSNRNICESAFLQALDAFGTQRDRKSEMAIREHMEPVVGVKFAVAGHVAILDAGISAFLHVYGHIGVAPTESSPDDTARAKAAALVDDIRFGLQIHTMIADPTPQQTTSGSKLRFLEAAWGAVAESASLIEMQGDSEADTPSLLRSWEKVRSLLKYCDALLDEGLVTEDMRSHEGWLLLKAAYEQTLNDARVAQAEFASGTVNAEKLKLLKSVAHLEGMNGGMFDGSLWKGSLAPSCDWDAALAAAQSTLFDKKQRGIARQMAVARADLDKASKEFHKLCESFDLATTYKEVADRVAQALKRTSTTITEAKLVQYMKDTKLTASLRRTNIQEELDAMVDHSLDSEDILAAIYEKAQDILRA